MNERIRDLGIQTGLYVDLNGTPWPRAMSAEESEAAYKKFAELIVKECADWTNENVGLITPEARQELYKHFGVEL